MTTDLASVRAELADRRARAAMVAERFAALVSRSRDGDEWLVVDVRCDKPCRDLLAKVYVVDEGALFVSRIRWLPSDQLTLRPWERDRYLSESLLRDVNDDELRSWLDRLDRWTLGLPAEGPRWLARGVDTGVRDVLTEPAGPLGWLPDLWTRCRRHPERAESADRAALLAATRAARAP